MQPSIPISVQKYIFLATILKLRFYPQVISVSFHRPTFSYTIIVKLYQRPSEKVTTKIPCNKTTHGQLDPT